MYDERWSLPWATFALALFALSLTRRRRVTRLCLGIVACGAYIYVLPSVVGAFVWNGMFSPVALAWLPNLVLVALAIVMMTFEKLTVAE